MRGPLSWRARLLLWDYERGSLAYDLLWIVLLLMLLLLPGLFGWDPLWTKA